MYLFELAKNSMLEVSNLSYRVNLPDSQGELSILEDIHFKVEKAQTIAIIGSSGSGKTTLLSLLAGLDVPTQGFVTIAGQTISDLDEEQRAAFRASHVGIIFQAFHLLPSLTALENVILPLELSGKRDSSNRAETLLKQVGLGSRLKHTPLQLSGGEQQRVAIARAFAADGDVLFADEPTGNLDHKTAKHIIELLFSLNKEEQKTLILVTHDQELAARCDRCFELIEGRLQEQEA